MKSCEKCNKKIKNLIVGRIIICRMQIDMAHGRFKRVVCQFPRNPKILKNIRLFKPSFMFIVFNSFLPSFILSNL